MFVSTETVEELAAALKETLGCALIGRVEPIDQTNHG
jgi:Ca-activated chloride channel family protein